MTEEATWKSGETETKQDSQGRAQEKALQTRRNDCMNQITQ